MTFGVAEIVTLAGALAGLGVWVARIIYNWKERQAGRNEAELKAARREAERAKDRQKIDADVRARGDDVVSDELRRDWSRD